MEDGHVQSNFKIHSPWLPTVKHNLKTQLSLQTKYADTCIYKKQFTWWNQPSSVLKKL